ncbi:MAG: HU family DNA-binding protein [Gammaproteobacteria bacterium]|nr:HU family DNA-binding protein [Gammaproteobacteria bacterium]
MSSQRQAAQAMIDGERIKLPGPATFSLHERAARAGRNPATGAAMDIPVKRTVHFKEWTK